MSAQASVSSEQGPLRLLRAKEAAVILAIGTRKLWSLTACGEIPHVRIGRAVRYCSSDLEIWIKAQTVGGCHG